MPVKLQVEMKLDDIECIVTANYYKPEYELGRMTDGWFEDIEAYTIASANHTYKDCIEYEVIDDSWDDIERALKSEIYER